jgi:hypothetical protein
MNEARNQQEAGKKWSWEQTVEENEECYLLGCNFMLKFNRRFGFHLFHAGIWLSLFSNPKDGCDMFFRNVSWVSMDYKALYPGMFRLFSLIFFAIVWLLTFLFILPWLREDEVPRHIISTHEVRTNFVITFILHFYCIISYCIVYSNLL